MPWHTGSHSWRRQDLRREACLSSGDTVPVGRWKCPAPRVNHVGGGVRHATRGRNEKAPPSHRLRSGKKRGRAKRPRAHRWSRPSPRGTSGGRVGSGGLAGEALASGVPCQAAITALRAGFRLASGRRGIRRRLRRSRRGCGCPMPSLFLRCIFVRREGTSGCLAGGHVR